MIIPKGKKFRFIAKNMGDITGNVRVGDVLTKGRAKKKGVDNYKKVKEDRWDLWEDYIIPSYGYMGNAYLGQDVTLNLVANFSKPLEGILGRIPHTFDLLYQATQGISINNARFTHMKYWTGTEPPEISLQLVFETQIDSYYDVYRPIVELMSLVLPEETEAGFYKSPVPSIKLIAKEAAQFIPKLIKAPSDLIKNLSSNKGKNLASDIEKKSPEVKNFLEDLASRVEQSGFRTDIYIGNNFTFKNIIIKNVSPNFSSELAYAPIHFLNKNKPYDRGGWFNPYTAGEIVTKTYAQSICAIAAQINNAVQTVAAVAKKLPGPIRNWVEKNIGDMPSFPVRAEVNLTFELQFPITRNKVKNKENSIISIFDDSGYNSLYGME